MREADIHIQAIAGAPVFFACFAGPGEKLGWNPASSRVFSLRHPLQGLNCDAFGGPFVGQL
jgi:hypothetical protein